MGHVDSVTEREKRTVVKKDDIGQEVWFAIRCTD